jgi:hypothetical protein
VGQGDEGVAVAHGEEIVAMRYRLRVEYPVGRHDDYGIAADTLEQARERLEIILQGVTSWDWRGAVAFVNGAKPAEEIGR